VERLYIFGRLRLYYIKYIKEKHEIQKTSSNISISNINISNIFFELKKYYFTIYENKNVFPPQMKFGAVLYK
jgi:hypothetical protein